MDKYAEFDKYLRSHEPDSKQRAELWQTSIGLQKVDGLDVSDFLVDTAKRHIEKDIDIAQAKELISTYYQKLSSNEKIAHNEEADLASANIVQLLSEPSFSFSVEGLAGIHRRIFQGIFNHAGKFREYDITKSEWVLDGATVVYCPCTELRQTIQYDLSQEKTFRYKGLTIDAVIEHFTEFIANLWQIHPFSEGNTRTTAVFAIKYLRAIGFTVENDMFKDHSWYFRNALVRANYRNVLKGIEPTREYLTLFFRNLLLGKANELRNRDLHVSADTIDKQE